MTASTRHNDYVLLIALLKRARERRGITQIELAKRLGNAQTFVSKVERGERRLDVVELIEFCEALEVPLEPWLKDYMRRRIEQHQVDQTKRKTAK